LRAKARPLATTRLAAPVPVPGAVFCAGANYADHVANMAKAAGRDPEPDPHHLGLKPWHFMKAPRSAVVGPSVSVKLPPYSKKIDWEIELAAVIGTQARGLSIEKALECVAGYTIANDLSARDCGKREHVADNLRSSTTGSGRSVSTVPARWGPGSRRHRTSPIRRSWE